MIYPNGAQTVFQITCMGSFQNASRMGAKCCGNRGILSRNHPGFFQCPDILQLDKIYARSYNALKRTRISHFKACARQCSTFIYTQHETPVNRFYDVASL